MWTVLKAKFDAIHAAVRKPVYVFWVVFSGLWMMLPAFQGVMSATTFFVFSAIVVASFIYGRLTKQEGIIDD